MVAVQQDAVPHVAGQKREGLDAKEPQGADGHFPADCLFVAFGWREGAWGQDRDIYLLAGLGSVLGDLPRAAKELERV